METVWVVICEQAYAYHWHLVGVYTSQEKADAVAATNRDYYVDDRTIDQPGPQIVEADQPGPDNQEPID